MGHTNEENGHKRNFFVYFLHVPVIIFHTEPFLEIFPVIMLEQVLGIEMSSLARDDLNPCHHMFKHFLVDFLCQCIIGITFPLNVEKVNNELDGAALEKDGKHDHCEGGGDEHLCRGNMALADHCHQGKSNCPSQSSIGHDELLLETNRLDIPPQYVDEEAETIDGDKSDQKTEEQSPTHKLCVPDMFLEESHSKVEEDDAVTDRTEHLDEVVDSGERLCGDVLESIVSLSDATTNQTEDP